VNFAFLGHHDPNLVLLGTQAEQLFAEDPASCLAKLRLFGERLAQQSAARLGLLGAKSEHQSDLLRRLSQRGAIDARTGQLFDELRRVGNLAAHENVGDHTEALRQLKLARELAVWFQRSFGNNRRFDPGPFVPPRARPPSQDQELFAELERLRKEASLHAAELEATREAARAEADKCLTAEQRAEQEASERAIYEQLALEAGANAAEAERAREALARDFAAKLAALQAQAEAAPAAELAARTEQMREASAEVELDEAATRRLIDAQLRLAGWEADSERLTYASGTRPEKGRNLAIAEWPIGNRRADYVLFVGPSAIGVVEAKRERIDISQGALQQAEEYSAGFLGGEDRTSSWGKRGFKIPFVFATNSRPYLKQIAEKSGTWFRDVRKDQNHARALSAWYTPEGLAALLKEDNGAANQALACEPTEYLGLRGYQVSAIRAIEEALPDNDDKPAMLVAMATGTGKTRTAIGLVYRLIKARRFRRVLFLVDRSALGEQAEDAFKDARLEGAGTFDSIYDVKSLGDAVPDKETKLHIATIQGMVRRILYPSDPEEVPPIDRYDCVIIDECHRGYGLDREMSEGELRFRDLGDYVSKFRRVLDHFDAVKIGLTATPALHTVEIFGEPIFRYTYREAVIDGWLVDQEPPIRIVTRLSQDGIHWEAGAEVKTYDPHTHSVQSVLLADELNIDLEGFNRQVRTESFNRVVCEVLAEHIDPSLEGKTLVFAVSDEHADMLVGLLREAFAARYGTIDNDAIVKITGAAREPMQLIRHFKNERLPSVAVTVDLLTTGVDVPKIANLVFLRRVKSRILYEQMLGRATRLCPEIGKTSYRVFDAVDLYAAIESFTDMVPVVARPNIGFNQLVRELETAPDESARQLVLEQLIAKLQRKRRALEGEQLARFTEVAEMSPSELALQLKSQSPGETAAWFKAHQYLLPILDERSASRSFIPISEHTDALIGAQSDFHAQRPEDYLAGFSAFIQDNQNRLPALIAVTQRPRDLTRKDLKALQLALSEHGYTDLHLQTAWREKTNADVAATILGFVRQAALGDPLVSYEERVRRALEAILRRQKWTAPQRQWLERIAKQIQIEKVVDRDALDTGTFKATGGYNHINRIFDGKLEEVLGDLGEAIWSEAG
jgi:type I restriction enzyme R subunit